MTAPCDLVLVGPRPGAVRAASQLGLRFLLVDDRPPAAADERRAVGWVQAPLEGDPAPLLAAVREHLAGALPQAVFACGERGVVAAALLREALGVAGTGPELARRARDKAAMKACVRAAGVPCADWLTLAPGTTAHEIVGRVGLPAVLKARNGSGSRGMEVLRSWVALERRLAALPAAERDRWMVERLVVGEEMSVESIVVGGRIRFVNPTEYFIPTCANIAPAELAAADLEPVLALNERALAAFGVERGMTHLELFRGAQGPVFGELAVRPPGGRIMRLLRRAYGFDPWAALLRVERGEDPPLPAAAREAAGVWMIHPGPGRVLEVEGFDEARRVAGVCKLVCRLQPGAVVGPRESTGSDTGWIEVHGPSRGAVVERLCAARQHLHILLDPVEGGGLKGRV